MRYRTLGKTGLEVSVLSFGASSLGSVFRETNEAESIQTVHAAIDEGINYIDVSPYYGLTKAEAVLGKALNEIPRDKFLLSTKAGRYGIDAFDFSAGRIVSSLEESLARLHTDYVDILYLHDIEFVPADIIIEEALPALNQLKQQGKIRFTGICGLPLALFAKVLPLANVDAIISYCHYSLNDTSLLGLLPLLSETNVGLVNASPLSMGLLNTRQVPEWHPASKEIQTICKQAAEFCEQNGADISKLAVQFSTANPLIPTTLVSTANPENIHKNAQWVSDPIEQELLAEVLKILSPIHNQSWSSGRPEYNEQ
ncbi:aldo/keto reductase [Paenibacillus solisilvae]|uniref:Aldo/keto reductase n=1 Tax=Paenibacillus solisilvae TaxID=2486751 RepID=A0ABW0W130_9BACL